MKRYRWCGKRVTDSSQAVIYIFSPDFVQIATFLASSESARHCLFWIICHRCFHYSLFSALFCRRMLASQKQCGTYQCCYKFWLWIFLFCNLFFRDFFVKTFFQHICFKIFFPTFFFLNFSRCLPVYRDWTDCTYLCYEKYDTQQAVEIGL